MENPTLVSERLLVESASMPRSRVWRPNRAVPRHQLRKLCVISCDFCSMTAMIHWFYRRSRGLVLKMLTPSASLPTAMRPMRLLKGPSGSLPFYGSQSFAKHQTSVSLSSCESKLTGLQAVCQEALVLGLPVPCLL